MDIEFRREKVKKFLKMKLSDIARQTDVALETWSRWVNGKRSPNLDTLREIAPRLGMNAVELAAGIEAWKFSQAQSQAA